MLIYCRGHVFANACFHPLSLKQRRIFFQIKLLTVLFPPNPFFSYYPTTRFRRSQWSSASPGSILVSFRSILIQPILLTLQHSLGVLTVVVTGLVGFYPHHCLILLQMKSQQGVVGCSCSSCKGGIRLLPQKLPSLLSSKIWGTPFPVLKIE